MTPEAAQSGGGESDLRWRTHPRFAGDGYVLLDSLRVGPEDLRHDNAAAMKFDAETAARLEAVLEDITNQAVLDDVLAALLECDTPSGLLARATEARRRTNGDSPPADR